MRVLHAACACYGICASRPNLVVNRNQQKRNLDTIIMDEPYGSYDTITDSTRVA
uniref:Uncharacterized protein n=1 Tax=Oryza sativa subsp. japonica TaxID=39947 RepID=Q10PY5_ORYSJ|nr:hypothetical protein LOC_Os03g11750 [Oryza sativa Japonica Group]